MSETWTTEQILALAPDDASAKAGRALATPRKWVTAGHDARAVWGECQGSGATPYQAQIDLSEPAFRCSCPSRKFPCKHGIGLFLLYATEIAAVPEAVPPAWVTAWLEKRDQKIEKKESTVETVKTEAQLAKAAADQIKRAAERQSKVMQGLQDLDRWLCDLVRQGIAGLPGKPYRFWDEVAARLVDAQAPGVARMLREMAGIPNSGEGWMDRLVERMGLLRLLLDGFDKLETGALSETDQADIRGAVGFSVRQEEVLARPGIADTWLTIGQRSYDEEQFRVHRTWLWGRNCGRGALLLDFTRPGQQPERTFVAGSAFEAELAYYPSGFPQRAVIKQLQAGAVPFSVVPGYGTTAEMLSVYAEALGGDPWLETFAAPVNAVVPIQQGPRWALRDQEGGLLWLHRQFAQPWRLMAISGGNPIAIAGEWDGAALWPLSAWADARFTRL